MTTQHKLHSSPRNYTLNSVNKIMDTIIKKGDNENKYTVINSIGNKRYQIQVTDSKAQIIGHL